MSSLRVVSAGAAVLLLLSLGIKAATLGRPEPVDDDARLLRSITAILARDGYGDVTTRQRAFVTAHRGACRIKARPYTPYGTARIAIETLGAPWGPTRYGHRGRWTDTPAKVAPLLIFYVQRELARLGIVTSRAAIVAASTNCPPPDALSRLSVAQR